MNANRYRQNTGTSREVLQFRDDAWKKYFSNENFLNKINKKFGEENMINIKEMAKIKLKRKYYKIN